MNRIVKFALIPIGLVVLVIAIVGMMFVFRLCPPIESGPQPPWCVNPERFDTDMAAIDNVLTAQKKELFENEFLPESTYVPGDVDYLDYSIVSKDYKVKMGIGPVDFFWVVCDDDKNCIDPYHSIYSTFSRMKSLGANFLYMTDFATIDDKREVKDNLALKRSEAEKVIEVADEYGLDTIVTINFMLDDNVMRHTEAGESVGRMGEQQMAAVFNNWNPTKAEMDEGFASWNELLPEYLKKWKGVEYISVNPTDLHYNFFTELDHLNEKMKSLIKLAKENTESKVCLSVDVPYVTETGIDFYLEADCIVVLFQESIKILEGVEEDAEKIKAKFDKHFQSPVFNTGKETFVMIHALSYDGYINKGWFEVGDYIRLGRTEIEDQKEQAIVYEGFFRSLYENEVPITGVFSYQYNWNDEMYPGSLLRQDWGPSIRGKDAEHVFYKWSRVLG